MSIIPDNNALRLPDSYTVVSTEDSASAIDAIEGCESQRWGRFWPATIKTAAFFVVVGVMASVAAALGWVTVSRQHLSSPSFRKPVQEKDETFLAAQGAAGAAAAPPAAATAAAAPAYYEARTGQVLTGGGTAASSLGYYNEPVPSNPVGTAGYASTVSDAAGGYPAQASAYATGAAPAYAPAAAAAPAAVAAAAYEPAAAAASAATVPAAGVSPYSGYTSEQMEAMYTTMTFTTTVRPDSLFCFALMMPHGYEKGLIQKLHERKESMFACDDYSIFSETAIEISPGPPVRVVAEPMGSMKCEYGGPFKLALNTDVFIRAWRKVFDDGKFLAYGWTVKVDPDCVFLPNRLREEVRKYNNPEAAYLNNCDQGLHGPIEVLSLGGMKAFRNSMDICATDKKLVDEKSTGGEDVFLRHCMALLKVTKLDNFALLSEQACFWEDPVKNGCTSGKVSFHPFKKPDLYFKCLDQAKEIDKSTTSKPTSTNALPQR